MSSARGLPESSQALQIELRHAQGYLPRGWIDGLTLANDTTDATNDISIAPGVCRSTVNIVNGTPSTLSKDQRDLEIPYTLLKQLDVSWAPALPNGGGRSGMLCPGSSISNTTWHIYVVGGPGKQDDVLAVDSATQATVLAELRKIGFTAYRRIGSILRESAAIVTFVQDGDYFQRKTLVADISAANPGTSAVSRTLSVPVGVRVRADVLLGVTNAAGAGSAFALLTDGSTTDTAPTSTLSQTSEAITASGGVSAARAPVQVYTDASATIRSRLSFSSSDVTLTIVTRGWWDTRGRNA